jgi:hypothetical protein
MDRTGLASWRHEADLIDEILRGGKPAEIPVEQATEFDLVINLATARTLGFTVPTSSRPRQRAYVKLNSKSWIAAKMLELLMEIASGHDPKPSLLDAVLERNVIGIARALFDDE